MAIPPTLVPLWVMDVVTMYGGWSGGGVGVVLIMLNLVLQTHRVGMERRGGANMRPDPDMGLRLVSTPGNSTGM